MGHWATRMGGPLATWYIQPICVRSIEGSEIVTKLDHGMALAKPAAETPATGSLGASNSWQTDNIDVAVARAKKLGVDAQSIVHAHSQRTVHAVHSLWILVHAEEKKIEVNAAKEAAEKQRAERRKLRRQGRRQAHSYRPVNASARARHAADHTAGSRIGSSLTL